MIEHHGPYTLRLCGTCDVQFADPMEEPGQAFYESHARYTGPELLYTSPRSLNWDQRWFLRDRPCPGGTLLDIGCGTGYFLAAARRAGYRVSGLDLSRPQLELARRLFGLADLHATTLTDYARSTTPGSFDVVTAFQVLEHVADPVGFIRDARTLLVPGGCLALGVPNWRVWRILREWLDHPPHHLTRWSRMSLTGALERGGFEVVRLREHRSAYSFFLRYLRLGLLRTAMKRFSSSTRGAPTPSATVLALSVAKVRALQCLDIPAQAVLNAVRAPGIILYALARVRG